MAVNPAQAAARYQQAMSSGQTKQKYIEGINATTVNPMALAAEKEDLYLQRIQEAVASGKRRRKLMEASPQVWKANSAGKGANRLADGAKAADAKMQAHFQKWAPIYDNISATVQAMPKGTLQAAKDRSAKAIEMSMQAAGRS